MPTPIAHAENLPGEPPFDQATFEAAQKAGKPILIHITATWCSVCKTQKLVIDRVLGEARFKPYVLLNVDFDTQKDLVRKFGARAQSTFIVFKGKIQEALTSGDTRPKAIELMLAKGVGA